MGCIYDNLITGVAGITKGINGRDRVRTLVASLPTTMAAWNAPGRRLPEPATRIRASSSRSIRGSRRRTRITSRRAWSASCPGRIALADRLHLRARLQAAVDARLQPARARRLAPTGARRTSTACRNVGVGAAVHVVRRNVVSRPHGRGVAPVHRPAPALVSYTLSKAEDNGTDFQSEFIAQDSGRGRNPNDLDGLPVGFDPDSEKGPVGAGPAAPLRRERHLHAAEGHRAVVDYHDWLGPARTTFWRAWISTPTVTAARPIARDDARRYRHLG